MTGMMLVYRTLGQVVNSPRSFGLGERAPQALVDAITACRHWLREELLEEKEPSSEDWMANELSQDADRTVRQAVIPDKRH